MTAEEVRKRIEVLSEPSYQQFSARLIPNVKAERIRGVRLPHLRKLAKEIVKGDWRAYLEEKSEVEQTFEETMLRGLVIGYAKMEWKERHRWICDFLPQIDNWSVCDSFCSTLKPAKHEKEKMWTFVKQCMQYKHLDVQGLMCVGPLDADRDRIEECFERMNILFHKLQSEYGSEQIRYLSMGMSDDYPIALKHGSNMIRLGTVIFGKRNYSI